MSDVYPSILITGGGGMLARALLDGLAERGKSAVALDRAALDVSSPEAVEAAFKLCQAVVLLFTPDDEARLHPDLHRDPEGTVEAQLTGQPRQNVLVEAGMAFALGSSR